ncbi:hypothetical protein Mapa_014513 [Marchantia paleacea]|nr:hypothetical protein Mapa_014513 [Marchantia paleacea]
MRWRRHGREAGCPDAAGVLEEGDLGTAGDRRDSFVEAGLVGDNALRNRSVGCPDLLGDSLLVVAHSNTCCSISSTSRSKISFPSSLSTDNSRSPRGRFLAVRGISFLEPVMGLVVERMRDGRP